jgi:hypothetical protein
MGENDFDKEIKKITKRAVQAKKQELLEEKAREREKQRITKTGSKTRSKQKDSTSYTAVIIAKLEYEGDNTPTNKQLAEDLGRIIMKWASQKGFYSINPKESVPKLVSVEVDVQ